MSKHTDLIAASERLTALVKEHEQSTIYEACTYHVVPLTGRPAYYLLYEIAGQKQVCEGLPAAIRKWLELRKIPSDKVYHYQLVKKPEPIQPEDEY